MFSPRLGSLPLAPHPFSYSPIFAHAQYIQEAKSRRVGSGCRRPTLVFSLAESVHICPDGTIELVANKEGAKCGRFTDSGDDFFVLDSHLACIGGSGAGWGLTMPAQMALFKVEPGPGCTNSRMGRVT
ncbi:hypothetical protein P175DRAFT_0532350 [Aspergillus ochraceoroseus IBT 24754]|uniref:Uncharacterized protein n=1 Tax=Aspergillus ochraceoroseus IBT 24754 TaxID=1392256 RepID=A0A2T5LXH3_9EURO|nr:uncharacterized protein P175DRAFT_0532350 [Aspergillus ochraceoroseus IBT 24754]PTU20980.1 hypothetical protein P175DRAFT_0532350 [Aspergillus ochraceoroseus IBT 24754]